MDQIGDCSGLQMSVWANTIYEVIICPRLPDKFITVLPKIGDLYWRLVEGACNVIILEGFMLAERFVRNAGHNGPYVIGKSAFAKELLALVPRSDDDESSGFGLCKIYLLPNQRVLCISADSFPNTDLFPILEETHLFRRLFKRVKTVVTLEEASGNGLASGLLSWVIDGSSGMLFPHPLGSILERTRDRLNVPASTRTSLL